MYQILQLTCIVLMLSSCRTESLTIHQSKDKFELIKIKSTTTEKDVKSQLNNQPCEFDFGASDGCAKSKSSSERVSRCVSKNTQRSFLKAYTEIMADSKANSKFETQNLIEDKGAVPGNLHYGNEESKLEGDFNKEQVYSQDGYYDYKLGEVVIDGTNNDSYTIVELLGMGLYGQVFKACDKKKNFFALKIIRGIEKYRRAGLKEIKILEELTRLDPKQDYVFSQLKCKFNLDSHVAFGQSLLGMSLDQFWRTNSFNSFPMCQIRNIIYQMAQTLKFLHTNKFVHGDIKLDNILFVNSSYDELHVQGLKYLLVRSTSICLIDYGIARYGADEYTGPIAARTWRAPEVFFKQHWDGKADIWGLGCVLYKLFTGYELFPGKTDFEVLILIEHTFGKFPERMIESEFGKKHFKNGFIDMSVLNEARALALVDEVENIKESFSKRLGEPDVRELMDLLLSMLKINPSERISAADVLNHKFFDKLTTTEKLLHGIYNAVQEET